MIDQLLPQHGLLFMNLEECCWHLFESVHVFSNVHFVYFVSKCAAVSPKGWAGARMGIRMVLVVEIPLIENENTAEIIKFLELKIQMFPIV